MARRCQSVKDVVEEASRILFAEQDCLSSKEVELYFRGESMNFQRKDEGTSLPLGTSFPSFATQVEEQLRK